MRLLPVLLCSLSCAHAAPTPTPPQGLALPALPVAAHAPSLTLDNELWGPISAEMTPTCAPLPVGSTWPEGLGPALLSADAQGMVLGEEALLNWSDGRPAQGQRQGGILPALDAALRPWVQAEQLRRTQCGIDRAPLLLLALEPGLPFDTVAALLATAAQGGIARFAVLVSGPAGAPAADRGPLRLLAPPADAPWGAVVAAMDAQTATGASAFSLATGGHDALPQAPSSASAPRLAPGQSPAAFSIRLPSLDELEGEPAPAHCFPGETLVATPAGDRPINQLGTGDWVWAVDRSTGQQHPAKVAFRWDSFGQQLIEIEASGARVSSTPTHRFADAETAGWTRAGQLTDGQMLILRDGDQLISAAIRVRPLPKGDVMDVHSLILEGPHPAWVAGGFVVAE